MSNYAITATKHYSGAAGSARLLQILIADAVNTTTDTAIRDMHELAEECNCTVQFVRRLIKEQINAGELIGLMSAKGGGAWCAFAIPIYPGEEGYDPQLCDGAEHVCNGYHTPLDVSRERLYRDKARAARQHAQPARLKRVQASVTRAKGRNDSFQFPGNGGFQTGNDSFDSGNGGFQTGNDSFHPPDPPIGRPISDPGITQEDPERAREQQRDAPRRATARTAESPDRDGRTETAEPEPEPEPEPERAPQLVHAYRRHSATVAVPPTPGSAAPPRNSELTGSPSLPLPPATSSPDDALTTIGGREDWCVWREVVDAITVSTAIKDNWLRPCRLFTFGADADRALLLTRATFAVEPVARFRSTLESLIGQKLKRRGGALRLVIRSVQEVRADEEALV